MAYLFVDNWYKCGENIFIKKLGKQIKLSMEYSNQKIIIIIIEHLKELSAQREWMLQII